MHDRNVPPIQIKHYDLPCAYRALAHVQKQDVPSEEARLHGATKYYHHLCTRLRKLGP